MKERRTGRKNFPSSGSTSEQCPGVINWSAASQVADYLIMVREKMFASTSPVGNKFGVQYRVRGKAKLACNLRVRFAAQVASFDASRLDAPSWWLAFGRCARFHSRLFL
jgi:hypothetical protein